MRLLDYLSAERVLELHLHRLMEREMIFRLYLALDSGRRIEIEPRDDYNFTEVDKLRALGDRLATELDVIVREFDGPKGLTEREIREIADRRKDFPPRLPDRTEKKKQ